MVVFWFLDDGAKLVFFHEIFKSEIDFHENKSAGELLLGPYGKSGETNSCMTNL